MRCDFSQQRSRSPPPTAPELTDFSPGQQTSLAKTSGTAEKVTETRNIWNSGVDDCAWQVAHISRRVLSELYLTRASTPAPRQTSPLGRSARKERRASSGSSARTTPRTGRRQELELVRVTNNLSSQANFMFLVYQQIQSRIVRINYINLH